MSAEEAPPGMTPEQRQAMLDTLLVQLDDNTHLRTLNRYAMKETVLSLPDEKLQEVYNLLNPEAPPAP